MLVSLTSTFIIPIILLGVLFYSYKSQAKTLKKGLAQKSEVSIRNSSSKSITSSDIIWSHTKETTTAATATSRGKIVNIKGTNGVLINKSNDRPIQISHLVLIQEFVLKRTLALTETDQFYLKNLASIRNQSLLREVDPSNITKTYKQKHAHERKKENICKRQLVQHLVV